MEGETNRPLMRNTNKNIRQDWGICIKIQVFCVRWVKSHDIFKVFKMETSLTTFIFNYAEIYKAIYDWYDKYICTIFLSITF